MMIAEAEEVEAAEAAGAEMTPQGGDTDATAQEAAAEVTQETELRIIRMSTRQTYGTSEIFPIRGIVHRTPRREMYSRRSDPPTFKSLRVT